ncbi:MAG: hypothetical protein ACI9ON_000951 [Limisphaerales bacterium]|jgi:hypothetical protein
MDQETKARLSDRTIWVRILYMVFFAFAYAIAEFLLTVVVVFQAVVVLVTGSVNTSLHTFGKNLSVYISDILHFQTFNSESLAFPFSDWPDEPADETKWSEIEDDDSDAQKPTSYEDQTEATDEDASDDESSDDNKPSQ